LYRSLDRAVRYVALQERSASMQQVRLVLVGILTVFFFLTSAPLAGGNEVVFKSQMICDTDGVAPFTDVVGVATISDNGNLKVKIRELRPSTAYTCLIFCNVGSKVAPAPCSTNAKGTLDALLPGLGRSENLASGCGQPGVTVFTDDPDDLGDFCMSGYDEP
jgi:hypothetical protein